MPPPLAQGSYLAAVELLNKLVHAEPDNQVAKDLLAKPLEQIGHQKESPSVRNSVLAAAFELRNGFPKSVISQPVNPDRVRVLSTDLLLDVLGIRLDSRKASGLAFVVNLSTPDHGEQDILERSHSTLTNSKGFQSSAADLSIAINRRDLALIMSGVSTFPALAAEGKVKLDQPGRHGAALLLDLIRAEAMGGRHHHQAHRHGPGQHRHDSQHQGSGRRSGGALRWSVVLNSGLIAPQLLIGIGFESLELIHGLLIVSAGAVLVVAATSSLWLDAGTTVGELALESTACSRDQWLALARSRLAELGIRKSRLRLQRLEAP